MIKINTKQNLLTIALISLINIVSSQLPSTQLENGSVGLAQLFISVFGPLFRIILGGTEELLFERVLIFLIIISIVYMTTRAMNIFSGNKAIVGIVTFSVSILIVRFMTISQLIYSVILPYTALGVTLTAILPLIIGFFFIHTVAEKSPFMRKTFWILFIVVFFAMWDLYYEQTGSLSWIYFWSAIISFFFFLFDGTIRRQLVKSRIQASGEDSAQNYARKIRRELEQLDKDHTAGHVDERYYKRIRRRLNNQLEEVLKH